VAQYIIVKKDPSILVEFLGSHVQAGVLEDRVAVAVDGVHGAVRSKDARAIEDPELVPGHLMDGEIRGLEIKG